jgi:hypothetical protein
VPFIKCVSVRWGFEQGLLPEQRAAFADFAMKIAVGYQPMEWLTWIAEFDSTAFSQADIDKYNDDMKRVFPDLVATRVVVSAAGIGRDTEIESIAGALYEFDSKIAKHLARYKSAVSDSDRQASAVRELANLHQALIDADNAFVAAVSKLVGPPPQGSTV